MKQTYSSQKNLSAALLLSSLAFLPGCFDGFKDKKDAMIEEEVVVNDGTPVLASLRGKPVYTERMFQQELDALAQADPNVAFLLQAIPGAEEKILEGLVVSDLLALYVAEKGIDQKPQYKQYQKQLNNMLNSQFLQQENPVAQPSEAEVKKFYEEHKHEIPGAVISGGGVRARGVMFNKKADADAFLNKAASGDFAKAAHGHNHKLVDFDVVTAASGSLNPILRERILAVERVPSTDMVKVDDNTYWVFNAMAKEPAQHQPFDKIKPQLTQMVTQQRQQEKLQEMLERLKNEYELSINRDYFAQKTAQQGQAAMQMQGMQEEGDQNLDMVMPQDDMPPVARGA
jgi:hypothetical protein